MKIACCSSSLWLWISLLHNAVSIAAPSSLRTPNRNSPPSRAPVKLPLATVVSSPRTLLADSVNGLHLTITYQWAASEGDLDSGVYFLNGAPLPDCLSANTAYVTGSGGTMTYQWSASQADLDSGVAFLRSTQGVDCLSANPDTLTGGGNLSVDANGFGRREAFTVNLGQSFVDGQWKRETMIRLSAGWASPGKGPVNVTVSTMQVLDDGTIVHGNDSVTFTFNSTGRVPGQCAAEVGTIAVVRNPSGNVTIQASTQQSGDSGFIGEALRNP
jgi:hypothetical protein